MRDLSITALIIAASVILGAMLALSMMQVGGWLDHKNEVKCPPIIERAGGLRLFFGEEPDLIEELTPLDDAFAEACGLEWQPPVRVPPPGEGGA
jgi:hypothetical protein